MNKIARNMILCALMTMSLSAGCFAEDATATTTEAEPQATATVTTTTQAAPDQNVVDWLDPAAGEWYSTKGNLVMTIEGNTINGCTVTDRKTAPMTIRGPGPSPSMNRLATGRSRWTSWAINPISTSS